MCEVEELDELLDRKDLTVPMRPPEPCNVVQHSLGEKALQTILENVDGAVALGQLPAVGTVNHRYVRILGHIEPKRLQ